MGAVAAGISAAGSLLGGVTGGKGAQKAAKIQAAAMQKGIDETARQFNVTQQNFAPYMAAGNSALNGTLNLLGLNEGQPDWSQYLAANPDVAAGYQGVDKSQFPTPEAYAQWHYNQYGQGEGRAMPSGNSQQAAIDALKASPAFTSLYDTGADTILQNASATGGLRGGNTQNSLAQFGSNLLSQVIQQQLSNYSGLISTGSGANSQLGNLGAQNSQQIAGLLGQQGAANATGASASAAAWQNAINGLANVGANYFSQPKSPQQTAPTANQTGIVLGPSVQALIRGNAW